MESWTILEAHPRYLVTLIGLDLSYCDSLTSKAIQAMMCEMPILEVFHTGGTLSTLDLLEDPRPWACLGLKEISMTFMEVPEGIGREILSLPSYLRKVQAAQSNIVKVLSASMEMKESDFEDSLDSMKEGDQSLPLYASPPSPSSPSASPPSSSDIFSRIAGLRSLEVLRAFLLLDLEGATQQLKVPGQLDQWRDTIRRLQKLGPFVNGIGTEERQWLLDHWPRIEIDLGMHYR